MTSTEQMQGLVETVAGAVDDAKALVPSVRRMTWEPSLSRGQPSRTDVKKMKDVAERLLDNVGMLEEALGPA